MEKDKNKNNIRWKTKRPTKGEGYIPQQQSKYANKDDVGRENNLVHVTIKN